MALEPNPVDAIWAVARRRRSPRCGCTTNATPARAVPPSGSGSAAEVGKKGADALLLTAANSIAWLLNVRGGDIGFNPLVLSYLLWTGTAPAAGSSTRASCPRDWQLPNAFARRADRDASRQALDELGGARVLADPGRDPCGLPGAADRCRSQAGRGRRSLRAGQGAEEPGRAARGAPTHSAAMVPRWPASWLG